MEIVHTPVLLKECLSYLSPVGEPYEQNAFMIDATLGEGGHSFHFLSQYSTLRILGLDADSAIQARAKERLSSFGERMHFFNGWFSDFFANYPPQGEAPNLILFDLGISVFHYEKSGRGFSFRYDEELDMRLNISDGKPAFYYINTMEEKELADMIYRYSDEKFSRRIASAIVSSRQGGEIRTSKALADIIFNAVPPKYRYGKIHPATRTFQALRILVNSELKHLGHSLQNAFNVLSVGGKLGVITFHSLEDRIVKHYFRNLAKDCVCPPEAPVCSCGSRPCAHLLTRKGVEPTLEEIQMNSPSRSAKLRVVKKIRVADEKRLLGVEAF